MTDSDASEGDSDDSSDEGDSDESDDDSDGEKFRHSEDISPEIKQIESQTFGMPKIRYGYVPELCPQTEQIQLNLHAFGQKLVSNVRQALFPPMMSG